MTDDKIEDQPTLIDFPVSSGDSGTAQRKKDPQRLLDGWVKNRTPKKNIKEMLDSVNTALESGVAYDDIEFLLGRKHLFPSQAKFSIENLRNAYRHLTQEKQIAEKETIAQSLLETWGSRTTVSKVSFNTTVNAVAKALLSGKSEKDVKYAFSQRTLLSSRKRVDGASLDKALKSVDMDKKAGSTSSKVFQNWYGNWYEGRYTQPPGQIVPIIKGALLAGIPEDTLVVALDRLGRSQQVISTPALQFAIQQAKKIEEQREASGTHSDLMPESDFDMMVDVGMQDNFEEVIDPWQ